MGSISGSGTVSAALTLAWVISCTPAPAQNPAGVTLDIAVSGLRNAKGNVLACMTDKPAFFLKCDKDPQSRKLRITAGQAQSIRFADVHPGTYAIAFIHDENANNKMDMTLFLPKEGFGFSRNPKMGMGPPKFASAAFVVGAVDAKMVVVMKYML